MLDVEATAGLQDTSVIESCYFVFVVEAEGTPLETEVTKVFKNLSHAIGKNFILIITQDNVNERKILLGKGGSRGTKVSLIANVPEHELQVYIIKEVVLEYKRLVDRSSRVGDESLPKNASKNVDKKKGKNKPDKAKIKLNNLTDDRPPMSPELFVVLVGFHNPYVIQEMTKQNYPVKCIVKLQEENNSTLYIGSSLRTFWEVVDLQVGLTNTKYFVKPLDITTQILKNEHVQNLNYMYDILCCVLYDIVNVVKEYTNYANDCHLYPLDYIPMKYTPLYEHLSQKIPMECTSVEYILHCVIEQVIDFDEKRKEVIHFETDSISSSMKEDFFGTSLSVHIPGKSNIKSRSKFISEDNLSLSDQDNQLPFVLYKYIQSNLCMLKTFHFRDKYARSLFHLEQFPILYLTLTNILKISVKHLMRLPHIIPIRKKSFFTFHVNRILKHVNSYLPYIKQRQIKYYLELFYLLQFLKTDLDPNQKNISLEVSVLFGNTKIQDPGDKCVKMAREKYEIKENGVSNDEENLNEDLPSPEFNISVDSHTENDNAFDNKQNIQEIYMKCRQQQTKELNEILFLDELKSIINFINLNKTSLDKLPFESPQVEHHDIDVLVQVLHEERFANEKCELRYFAPTDSFLIIFYNPAYRHQYWSSSGCLPAFMSIGSFFKSDLYEPRNTPNEENILSYISSQEIEEKSASNWLNNQDKRNSIYAYDVEDLGDLFESETTCNESGLAIKIKKCKLGTKHYASATLQYSDIFVNINCPKKEELSGSKSPRSSLEEVNNIYAVGESIRLVLTNNIIVNIYKCTSKSMSGNLSTLYESKSIGDILNFSITFPNGLFVETVQIGNEIVIRQCHIQNLKDEICRYYFKTGKVLTAHKNDVYYVYHGNGDKTYCEGIFIEKEQSEAEQSTFKSSETKSTKHLGKRKGKDSIEILSSVSKKVDVKINKLEHLSCLGKYKRFERGKLTEEYQKYGFKYACCSSPGELYVSRGEEVQLYFLETKEKNTLITKFDNNLTFTSDCCLRNGQGAEETGSSEILHDLMNSINSFNMNNVIDDDEMDTREIDDRFVIIEQTWKIENETFAPIMFSSDGKCEIVTSDFNVCYEANNIHIVNDSCTFKLQADLEVVNLSFGNKNQENQVFVHWNNSSDCLIQFEHGERSILNFKSDGSVLTEQNEQNNVPPNDVKCFVLNRDGSGYQFIDGVEVSKHKHIQTTFPIVVYDLTNCNALHQTNIQRKVNPLNETFLFKPTSIRPVALTRDMLKESKESNDWLFYADSNIRPEVKFSEPFVSTHESIEVRKFEKTIPPDVDLINILTSALQDYCDEGSFLCQKFGIQGERWMEQLEDKESSGYDDYVIQ